RPVLCLSLLPGAQAGARVECARRQLQIQTRFLDRLLGRVRDQPADRQRPLLIDPRSLLYDGYRHVVLPVVGGGRVRRGRGCLGGRGCGGGRECENRPCQQEECAQQGGDQSQAADGNGFHGSSRDTIGDAAATMRRSLANDSRERRSEKGTHAASIASWSGSLSTVRAPDCARRRKWWT